MRLTALKKELAICKLTNFSNLPWQASLCFACKTDEELSLVCDVDCVPENAFKCDSGWRAFRVEGVLEFSLVGILAKLSNLLAEANIGIFAVSTYNTDYILTKTADFERALATLAAAGYEVAG